MKSLLRTIAINGFSIFAASQIIAGLKVKEGFPTFLFGGAALTLLTMLIRPILSLIAFPINLITFGMFSFFINAIILYLLTAFVPQISVHSFVFKGFSFVGFVIPSIYFNTFFAFVVTAAVLSIIISFLTWVTKS
ncbi:MAG: phage holin family protein [Candidatus Levyibacteriota bacterium]